MWAWYILNPYGYGDIPAVHTAVQRTEEERLARIAGMLSDTETVSISIRMQMAFTLLADRARSNRVIASQEDAASLNTAALRLIEILRGYAQERLSEEVIAERIISNPQIPVLVGQIKENPALSNPQNNILVSLAASTQDLLSRLRSSSGATPLTKHAVSKARSSSPAPLDQRPKTKEKNQPAWRQFLGRKILMMGSATLAALCAAVLTLNIYSPQTVSQIPYLDTFSPIANTLGIVGPVSLTLALWLSIKNSYQAEAIRRGVEETRALVAEAHETIRRISELEAASRQVGFKMHYENRADAFFGNRGNGGFLELMDIEVGKNDKGEIIIIGTSLVVGMLKGKKPQREDFDSQEAYEKAHRKYALAQALEGIIQKARATGCTLRFLLAYPSHEITGLREDYEKRPKGSILKDIEEAVVILTGYGIDPTNIRFYKEAPHLFMAILPNYLLAQPYALLGSGYEQPCFIWENANRPNSPYAKYRENDYQALWNSSLTVSLAQYTASGDKLYIQAKVAVEGVRGIKKRIEALQRILRENGFDEGIEYETLQDALLRVFSAASQYRRKDAAARIANQKQIMNAHERRMFDLVFEKCHGHSSSPISSSSALQSDELKISAGDWIMPFESIRDASSSISSDIQVDIQERLRRDKIGEAIGRIDFVRQIKTLASSSSISMEEYRALGGYVVRTVHYDNDSYFSVAELGANIVDLVLGGKRLIWHKGFDTAAGKVTRLTDEKTGLPLPGGIPFMFPWTSRVHNGKAFFRGREIDLTDTNLELVRRTQDGNPLHGMTDKVRWHFMDRTRENYLSLSYSTEEHHEISSRFGILRPTLTFGIRRNRLFGHTEVVNQDNVPRMFSFGHHGFYFLEDIESWFAQILADEYWQVHDAGLNPGSSQVPRYQAPLAVEGLTDIRKPVQLIRPFEVGLTKLLNRHGVSASRFFNPKTGETLRFVQSAEYKNNMFWVPLGNQNFPKGVASIQQTTSAANAINLDDRGIEEAHPIIREPQEIISASWSIRWGIHEEAASALSSSPALEHNLAWLRIIKEVIEREDDEILRVYRRANHHKIIGEKDYASIGVALMLVDVGNEGMIVPFCPLHVNVFYGQGNLFIGWCAAEQVNSNTHIITFDGTHFDVGQYESREIHPEILRAVYEANRRIDEGEEISDADFSSSPLEKPFDVPAFPDLEKYLLPVPAKGVSSSPSKPFAARRQSARVNQLLSDLARVGDGLARNLNLIDNLGEESLLLKLAELNEAQARAPPKVSQIAVVYRSQRRMSKPKERQAMRRESRYLARLFGLKNGPFENRRIKHSAEAVSAAFATANRPSTPASSSPLTTLELSARLLFAGDKRFVQQITQANIPLSGPLMASVGNHTSSGHSIGNLFHEKAVTEMEQHGMVNAVGSQIQTDAAGQEVEMLYRVFRSRLEIDRPGIEVNSPEATLERLLAELEAFYEEDAYEQSGNFRKEDLMAKLEPDELRDDGIIWMAFSLGRINSHPVIIVLRVVGDFLVSIEQYLSGKAKKETFARIRWWYGRFALGRRIGNEVLAQRQLFQDGFSALLPAEAFGDPRVRPHLDTRMMYTLAPTLVNQMALKLAQAGTEHEKAFSAIDEFINQNAASSPSPVGSREERGESREKGSVLIADWPFRTLATDGENYPVWFGRYQDLSSLQQQKAKALLLKWENEFNAIKPALPAERLISPDTEYYLEHFRVPAEYLDVTTIYLAMRMGGDLPQTVESAVLVFHSQQWILMAAPYPNELAHGWQIANLIRDTPNNLSVIRFLVNAPHNIFKDSHHPRAVGIGTSLLRHTVRCEYNQGRSIIFAMRGPWQYSHSFRERIGYPLLPDEDLLGIKDKYDLGAILQYFWWMPSPAKLKLFCAQPITLPDCSSPSNLTAPPASDKEVYPERVITSRRASSSPSIFGDSFDAEGRRKQVFQQLDRHIKVHGYTLSDQRLIRKIAINNSMTPLEVMECLDRRLVQGFSGDKKDICKLARAAGLSTTGIFESHLYGPLPHAREIIQECLDFLPSGENRLAVLIEFRKNIVPSNPQYGYLSMKVENVFLRYRHNAKMLGIDPLIWVVDLAIEVLQHRQKYFEDDDVVSSSLAFKEQARRAIAQFIKIEDPRFMPQIPLEDRRRLIDREEVELRRALEFMVDFAPETLTALGHDIYICARDGDSLFADRASRLAIGAYPNDEVLFMLMISYDAFHDVAGILRELGYLLVGEYGYYKQHLAEILAGTAPANITNLAALAAYRGNVAFLGKLLDNAGFRTRIHAHELDELAADLAYEKEGLSRMERSSSAASSSPTSPESNKYRVESRERGQEGERTLPLGIKDKYDLGAILQYFWWMPSPAKLKLFCAQPITLPDCSIQRNLTVPPASDKEVYPERVITSRRASSSLPQKEAHSLQLIAKSRNHQLSATSYQLRANPAASSSVLSSEEQRKFEAFMIFLSRLIPIESYDYVGQIMRSIVAPANDLGTKELALAYLNLSGRERVSRIRKLITKISLGDSYQSLHFSSLALRLEELTRVFLEVCRGVDETYSGDDTVSSPTTSSPSSPRGTSSLRSSSPAGMAGRFMDCRRRITKALSDSRLMRKNEPISRQLVEDKIREVVRIMDPEISDIFIFAILAAHHLPLVDFLTHNLKRADTFYQIQAIVVTAWFFFGHELPAAIQEAERKARERVSSQYQRGQNLSVTTSNGADAQGVLEDITSVVSFDYVTFIIRRAQEIVFAYSLAGQVRFSPAGCYLLYNPYTFLGYLTGKRYPDQETAALFIGPARFDSDEILRSIEALDARRDLVFISESRHENVLYQDPSGGVTNLVLQGRVFVDRKSGKNADIRSLATYLKNKNPNIVIYILEPVLGGAAALRELYHPRQHAQNSTGEEFLFGRQAVNMRKVLGSGNPVANILGMVSDELASWDREFGRGHRGRKRELFELFSYEHVSSHWIGQLRYEKAGSLATIPPALRLRRLAEAASLLTDIFDEMAYVYLEHPNAKIRVYLVFNPYWNESIVNKVSEGRIRMTEVVCMAPDGLIDPGDEANFLRGHFLTAQPKTWSAEGLDLRELVPYREPAPEVLRKVHVYGFEFKKEALDEHGIQQWYDPRLIAKDLFEYRVDYDAARAEVRIAIFMPGRGDENLTRAKLAYPGSIEELASSPISEPMKITLGEREFRIGERIEGVAFEPGEPHYYDFQILSGRNRTVNVVPKFSKDDIWRDPCWHMRREISERLNFLSGDDQRRIFTLTELYVLRLTNPDARIDDVLRVFLAANVEKFVAKVNEYRAGRDYHPNENLLYEGTVLSAHYSHINLFSWIYHLEIKIVEHILNHTDGIVTVLDAGCGMGDFIFVSDRILQRYRKRLSFIGVDIAQDVLARAGEYAQQHGPLQVRFIRYDLRRALSAEAINGVDKFGVMTVNHLFEHLERPPFTLLMNWLNAVRHALVFSLPEQPPLSQTLSAHEHTFTAGQLASLAAMILSNSRGRIRYDNSFHNAGIGVYIPQNSIIRRERGPLGQSLFNDTQRKPGSSPATVPFVSSSPVLMSRRKALAAITGLALATSIPVIRNATLGSEISELAEFPVFVAKLKGGALLYSVALSDERIRKDFAAKRDSYSFRPDLKDRDREEVTLRIAESVKTGRFVMAEASAWGVMDTSAEKFVNALGLKRWTSEVNTDYAKAKRGNRPLVILDWGAGTARELIDFDNNYLKKAGINNAILIAYANEYSPAWEKAPSNIIFVWDVMKNLSRCLERIFKDKNISSGGVDLLCSYYGLVHISSIRDIDIKGNERKIEDVLFHFKQLGELCAPGSAIRTYPVYETEVNNRFPGFLTERGWVIRTNSDGVILNTETGATWRWSELIPPLTIDKKAQKLPASSSPSANNADAKTQAEGLCLQAISGLGSGKHREENALEAISRYGQAAELYRLAGDSRAELSKYSAIALRSAFELSRLNNRGSLAARGAPDRRPILIAGGTGFIGQHYVEQRLRGERFWKTFAQNRGLVRSRDSELLEALDFSYTYKLVAIGSSEERRKLSPLIQEGIATGEIDVQLLDISRSSSLEAIRKQYPEGFREIVDLSGQANVARSFREPLRTFEINIGGALNIAQLARESAARLFYLSTTHVYEGGRCAGEVHTNINPLSSPYAESKFLAEIIYGLLCSNVVIFRTTNVFGPRDVRRVIPAFEEKIAQGQPVEITDSSIQISFIYVLDLISEIIKTMVTTRKGYFVFSSPAYLNLETVAKLIAFYLDKPLEVFFSNEGRRAGFTREEIRKFAQALLNGPDKTLTDFATKLQTLMHTGAEAVSSPLSSAGEREELALLISARDINTAGFDRLVLPNFLKAYWWLRGYSLRVKHEATKEDLKAVLINEEIKNVAVVGHGNWEVWEDTAGVCVREEDIIEWMGDVRKKKLFVNYCCGSYAFERRVDFDKKFGFHAVENPWENLRGAADFDSTQAILKPSLFSLKQLAKRKGFTVKLITFGIYNSVLAFGAFVGLGSIAASVTPSSYKAIPVLAGLASWLIIDLRPRLAEMRRFSHALKQGKVSGSSSTRNTLSASSPAYEAGWAEIKLANSNRTCTYPYYIKDGIKIDRSQPGKIIFRNRRNTQQTFTIETEPGEFVLVPSYLPQPQRSQRAQRLPNKENVSLLTNELFFTFEDMVMGIDDATLAPSEKEALVARWITAHRSPYTSNSNMIRFHEQRLHIEALGGIRLTYDTYLYAYTDRNKHPRYLVLQDALNPEVYLVITRDQLRKHNIFMKTQEVLASNRNPAKYTGLMTVNLRNYKLYLDFELHLSKRLSAVAIGTATWPYAPASRAVSVARVSVTFNVHSRHLAIRRHSSIVSTRDFPFYPVCVCDPEVIKRIIEPVKVLASPNMVKENEKIVSRYPFGETIPEFLSFWDGARHIYHIRTSRIIIDGIVHYVFRPIESSERITQVWEIGDRTSIVEGVNWKPHEGLPEEPVKIEASTLYLGRISERYAKSPWISIDSRIRKGILPPDYYFHPHITEYYIVSPESQGDRKLMSCDYVGKDHDRPDPWDKFPSLLGRLVLPPESASSPSPSEDRNWEPSATYTFLASFDERIEIKEKSSSPVSSSPCRKAGLSENNLEELRGVYKERRVTSRADIRKQINGFLGENYQALSQILNKESGQHPPRRIDDAVIISGKELKKRGVPVDFAAVIMEIICTREIGYRSEIGYEVVLVVTEEAAQRGFTPEDFANIVFEHTLPSDKTVVDAQEKAQKLTQNLSRVAARIKRIEREGNKHRRILEAVAYKHRKKSMMPKPQTLCNDHAYSILQEWMDWLNFPNEEIFQASGKEISARTCQNFSGARIEGRRSLIFLVAEEFEENVRDHLASNQDFRLSFESVIEKGKRGISVTLVSEGAKINFASVIRLSAFRPVNWYYRGVFLHAISLIARAYPGIELLLKSHGKGIKISEGREQFLRTKDSGRNLFRLTVFEKDTASSSLSQQVYGLEIRKLRDVLKRALDPENIFVDRLRSLTRDNTQILREIISTDNVMRCLYVQLDISNACNSLCVWCGLGTRGQLQLGAKRGIEKETVLKILSELHQEGFKPIVRIASYMGEPLLGQAKAITLEAIQIAAKYGFPVILTTNAKYMDEETWQILATCCTEVNISLDALSQEVHDALKPGDRGFYLQKIANILGLATTRSQMPQALLTNLQVSFMFHQLNFNQIADAGKLKAIGVDTFTVKVAHNEPNARLNAAQLEEAYTLIETTNRKLAKINFIRPLQTLAQAKEKMHSNTVPKTEKCFTQKYQSVFFADQEGTLMHPCCQYPTGSVGAAGIAEERSFGELWRSEVRMRNLGHDPRQHCRQCAPTDAALNELFGLIARTFEMDIETLPLIQALLERDDEVIALYDTTHDLLARLDPFFGGALSRALRGSRRWSMRDITRVLSTQARHIGAVDTDTMLRKDRVETIGGFEVMHNPGKDHAVKQQGLPPHLRGLPQTIPGIVQRYGLASLYLLPAFIVNRFRRTIPDCVLCDLPYVLMGYPWRRWMIYPDIYPWGLDDVSVVMSQSHRGQNNVTLADMRDMFELARALGGYQWITYGSLGAGSKVDHLNFRLTGPLPVLRFPLRQRRVNAALAHYTVDKEFGVSLPVLGGTNSREMILRAWEEIQSHKLLNFLLGYRDNQWWFYAAIRSQEGDDSIFGQPTGPLDVFGRHASTRQDVYYRNFDLRYNPYGRVLGNYREGLKQVCATSSPVDPARIRVLKLTPAQREKLLLHLADVQLYKDFIASPGHRDLWYPKHRHLEKAPKVQLEFEHPLISGNRRFVLYDVPENAGLTILPRKRDIIGTDNGDSCFLIGVRGVTVTGRLIIVFVHAYDFDFVYRMESTLNDLETRKIEKEVIVVSYNQSISSDSTDKFNPNRAIVKEIKILEGLYGNNFIALARPGRGALVATRDAFSHIEVKEGAARMNTSDGNSTYKTAQVRETILFIDGTPIRLDSLSFSASPSENNWDPDATYAIKGWQDLEAALIYRGLRQRDTAELMSLQHKYPGADERIEIKEKSSSPVSSNSLPSYSPLIFSGINLNDILSGTGSLAVIAFLGRIITKKAYRSIAQARKFKTLVKSIEQGPSSA
ncbi:MAG: NAD-dependent epimerase/dehydratase family protein, partial [Candidatus Omnitrophica bacterium]|nr:NAD-dependent epimerase/dehydratase family protein [Candidatus Omnitrophota bacterium]